MTTARDPRAAALQSEALDLPVLMAACSSQLNRLARQPVLVRREQAAAAGGEQIELLFGMDHANLNQIESREWLRTEHDEAACGHLVQQLKALFAVPASAGLEITTTQRPA